MHERIVEIDHTFWTYLLFHPLYLLVFILRHLGFTCSIATFAGNPIWNFDTPMPHGLRKVFEGTMVVWPITGKTMVWRPGKGKHSPPGGNEVHTRGGLGGSGCSYTTKNQANLHGKKKTLHYFARVFFAVVGFLGSNKVDTTVCTAHPLESHLHLPKA